MHRLVVVQVRNYLLMSQKILPGPCKCSALSQNSISHSNPYKSSLKVNLHCHKKSSWATKMLYIIATELLICI